MDFVHAEPHQTVMTALQPYMGPTRFLGEYDLWLDPGSHEAKRLQALLRPYPAEDMMAYPVSTRVNNPANDSPECMEPAL